MTYPYLNKAQILDMLLARDVERGFSSLQDLPLPQNLTHAFEGAQIVAKCINKGQEVLVVGDYDADGVCASAIMVRFFRILGYENMRLIIPHRFNDGYGVSAPLLEKYANNATVIVSVDNGITALSAGEWCKSAGVSLVITDHHMPTGDIPNADVIIDPYLSDCTFPQKAICGAVVAWYFCAALKQILKAKVDMGIFLGYLAIASVGDIMPLVGINRLFVKKGIESLARDCMPFAQILRGKSKQLDSQTLAFSFIPLLNAAGRVASADIALEFLVSEDFTQAKIAYDKLVTFNNERKQIQNEILESARVNLMQNEYIAISYAKGWHEGVLGIVASSLARECKKSTFIFSEHNNVLKGSGRSFGGVNLIKSITSLEGQKKHLLAYGGHSGAVGLSLERSNLEHFFTLLPTTLIVEKDEEDGVLGVIKSTDINEELMEILQSFEPFGVGNPTPIFICEKMRIESIKPLGKKNKDAEKEQEIRHFEYVLQDMTNEIRLIGVEFFAPCMREIGQCGDVYFEIIRDSYCKRLKLKIIDFIS